MYIGIDIGGTTCRIANTLSLENLSKISKKEFKLVHDFEKDFCSLVQIIIDFKIDHISGIGIGLAGSISKEKSLLERSTHLPEWTGIPIQQLLNEHFHCPIVIDNDLVAAATGEAYYDENITDDFVVVGWGTGMGGAKVTLKEKPLVEKLNWHEYFEDWENDCGGNSINLHFGKSAKHLTDVEWKDVMNNFKKHLLLFVDKIQKKRIIFTGGIANKQIERLKKIIRDVKGTECTLSKFREETGLYGSFALLRNTL